MNPTILVVDDNPKVKESLALAFPEYRFTSALSGEDGLKYLRKSHEIDLVLLDYKMGGLNGIEVLKAIRLMEPRLGVIMLTSFGSKDLAVEALRGTADDFVDKPFSVDQIKQKLETFFEKRAEAGQQSGTDGTPVQRMLRFVERNYRKNPTLGDIAGKTSLSPKYVSRKFKQETNETFSHFKIKLKMEQAKNLLQKTSLSIAQIAYKVGYENAESFMKMFKRVLGCTPTEYRQKENGR